MTLIDPFMSRNYLFKMEELKIMKLEFFEPPMCCSTGICGPSVDETLVKLKENIDYLKKKYNGLGISNE